MKKSNMSCRADGGIFRVKTFWGGLEHVVVAAARWSAPRALRMQPPDSACYGAFEKTNGSIPRRSHGC